MAQPAHLFGPFERAVREALAAEVSSAVADALLHRALSAAALRRVPEEIGAFRTFVEGPLTLEMSRVLDGAEIAIVLERLGSVLWMATSDVRTLSVAREWTERSRTSAPPPTPQAVRPSRASGPVVRPRSLAPSEGADALPSSVLVLSLDPDLVAQTKREIGGRCAVLAVGSPVELARAVPQAGDRPVVLVDTTLPSIDVPTFAGLCPILPASTRVVLWGADAYQQSRLATRFARASSWIASGDARAPGVLVLSLA